jgi:hypothetical protein
LEPTDGIVIEGELTAAMFRGRFYQLTIATGDEQLIFELPLTKIPAVGSKLSLWLNPNAISVLE